MAHERVTTTMPAETVVRLRVIEIVTGKNKSAIVREGVDRTYNELVATPEGAKIVDEARLLVVCR